MICDGHLHYWLRLTVDTTWPWMWHPQLYRTHQYTEELELSLFVVLYADRIGVVGGYWIPESLVCHGHPPTRCHAPPPTHLTSSQQGPPVYRAAGVISLCCVVCRQNRGSGRILDTGITCLSWSSPHTVPRPPPHLTSSPQGPPVYRGAGVISLCWAVFSQNLTFSAIVLCLDNV